MVVNVFRPVMVNEPSGSGTAIVAGRPPRLGLPISGSDAAELIRAPSSIAARATRT